MAVKTILCIEDRKGKASYQFWNLLSLPRLSKWLHQTFSALKTVFI